MGIGLAGPAAVTTVTMKQALASVRQKLPEDGDLLALSRIFNDALETWKKRDIPEKAQAQAEILKLLKKAKFLLGDLDRFKPKDQRIIRKKGFMSWDELSHVARKDLLIHALNISGGMLKGLWVVLDADEDNYVSYEDFATFFSSGAKSEAERAAEAEARAEAERKRKEAAAAPTIVELLKSAPTRVMRATLNDRGVIIPPEEELVDLAKELVELLEAKRIDEKKPKVCTHISFDVMPLATHMCLPACEALSLTRRREPSIPMCCCHSCRDSPTLRSNSSAIWIWTIADS